MKLNILNEEISFYVENNNKPKVLFLHGFNSGIFLINPLKELQRDYDIIIFDYPGCNNSTNNSVISLELYQEITTKVLDYFQNEKLIVLAHSLGAASALFNMNHKAIKQIILLAPINPYILENNSAHNLEQMLLPEDITSAKKSLELLVQNKDKTNYFENIDSSAKSFLKNINSKRLVFNYLVTEQITNETYLKTNIKNLYQASPSIALVIGKEDHFTPLSSILKTNTILQSQDITIFDNTGHALIYERPDEINAIINSYVKISK